jgi:hypothetical protein
MIAFVATASARLIALTRIVLLLVAFLPAGCEPPLRVDAPRLNILITEHAIVANRLPDVVAAYDALWSDVFAAADVKAAGGQLLPAIAANPGVAAGSKQILDRFRKRPEVEQAVRAFVKTHRGARAADVGAHVQSLSQRFFVGPAAEKAMQDAVARLIERPEIHGAFRRLGDGISRHPGYLAAVSAAIDERATQQSWRTKLMALNGGHVPDAARATDLLAEHAFSARRIGDASKAFVVLPGIKGACATFAREVVDSPRFRQELAAAIGAVLTDADFQDRVVDTLVVSIDEKADIDAFKVKLDKALAAAAITRELGAVVDRLGNDAELQAIGGRALSAMVADPGFKPLVANLCDAW